MDFKHMPMHGANYTDADIKRLITEYNVQFIKLQFVDINGQVKNLAVPSEHIDRVLNNDIMLDGSSIKGFRNIETSDMFFYPDKNTFQILPWQERDGKNSARLICDIYNADGKYLGTGKAITANFKKSPLQLLSLFTQKQKAPSFNVAAAARGDKLKFALPALKNGRIYRLQISTPDGKNVYTHVFDRAQNLPVRAIAYNEPAGVWKAALTDVASGLTTKVQFTVK